jgi:hypothetical protein
VTFITNQITERIWEWKNHVPSDMRETLGEFFHHRPISHKGNGKRHGGKALRILSLPLGSEWSISHTDCLARGRVLVPLVGSRDVLEAETVQTGFEPRISTGANDCKIPRYDQVRLMMF